MYFLVHKHKKADVDSFRYFLKETYNFRCVLNCIMMNSISPQIKLAISSECTNCQDDTSNVDYKWSVIGGNITDINNRTQTGTISVMEKCIFFKIKDKNGKMK